MTGLRLPVFGPIYRQDLLGSVTPLHAFSTEDGVDVQTPLLLAGRTLYGAAPQGGVYPATGGTIFAIGTDGSNYRVLHGFSGPDGYSPYATPVHLPGGALAGVRRKAVQAMSRNDQLGYGVLLTIGSDGCFRTLHDFFPENGANPLTVLADATGRLFGSTFYGGGCTTKRGGCGVGWGGAELGAGALGVGGLG